MRSWLLIGILILLIVATILVSGILIYNKSNTDKQEYMENNSIIKNDIEENSISNNVELLETASETNRVSPNCMFIFKTYFQRCDHVKVEKEQVEESMVNKTRDDLEKIYKDWKIITFRNDEVLFYKEEDEICDEHYLLKEHDGYIAIYTVDEHDNISLNSITSIIINYLPQEDITKLKEGIKVNGKEQLNRTLEDYE